jgi:hypothetical protein
VQQLLERSDHVSSRAAAQVEAPGGEKSHLAIPEIHFFLRLKTWEMDLWRLSMWHIVAGMITVCHNGYIMLSYLGVVLKPTQDIQYPSDICRYGCVFLMQWRKTAKGRRKVRERSEYTH